MPAPLTPWTEARIEMIVRLWEIDGLSASLVANRLGGTSRGAVLGKLKRLGKLGKRREAQHHRAPKRLRTTRIARLNAVAPGFKLPNPILGVEPDPLGLSVLDLKNGVCKWPFGDPRQDFGGFCGHPAHGSYCGFHDQIAHA